MGVGVWKQDPATGQWGLSSGTDPNLPIDTSFGQDGSYGPGQNKGPGGVSDAGVYSNPTTPVASANTFSNPLDYISNYQQTNAASPQAALTLLQNLQSQYGWNRWSDPTYGLSNNETTNNGQKWKVYSEGGNSWYTPGTNEGNGSSAQNYSAIAPQYTATGSAGNSSLYSVPKATAPQSSALDAATQAAILKLLGTDQTVDPATLRSSSEFRAYSLGAQRAEERQRAQLAEQAAGQGWSSSGGFDTTLAGLRQQRGEGEAGFLGQLATTQMTQKRQDLAQGIQFAMSSGQFDKAQQLQAELANIDAALRQSQLQEQGRQFDLGLGFNYDQLQTNANQNAVLQGLL